jgi:hypothetical protein
MRNLREIAPQCKDFGIASISGVEYDREPLSKANIMHGCLRALDVGIDDDDFG